MKSAKKILEKFKSKTGQVALLIDPDKTNTMDLLSPLLKKAEFANIAYVFVGGSTVSSEDFRKTVLLIKSLTSLPVIIFPGDYQQISKEADALLYLSLLSGRNPEYLITQHVRSAQEVYQLGIEIIPTAYIIMDGGKQTAVSYISQTVPIARENQSIALNTAIAGVLQGKQLLFFDAGSGAKYTVEPELIHQVVDMLNVPVIVGGGIRSTEQLNEFKNAGAHIIVVGNKIEEDINFLLEIHAFTEGEK